VVSHRVADELGKAHTGRRLKEVRLSLRAVDELNDFEQGVSLFKSTCRVSTRQTRGPMGLKNIYPPGGGLDLGSPFARNRDGDDVRLYVGDDVAEHVPHASSEEG